MGWENGADYFKWALEVDPKVTFYVNEYGVLQGNEVDQYVAHIKELQAAGAKIGGIGDQAHFFKPMPANEDLWEILDKLGQFGLPVKITEFDYQHKKVDEEQRAEDFVRFYKLCFAHPAVEGIYMWGFWDPVHWRDRAGLFTIDWTPKPVAKAYMKLMDEEWRTVGTLAANEKGEIRFRGFPGKYLIQVGEASIEVELTKDHPEQTIQF